MATLTYFGHAAVGVTANDGTRLVVDPFEPGGFDGQMQYEPIPESAEYAVCTHDHADHSAFGALAGQPPTVVKEGRGGPFRVRRTTFMHDEYEGERFGGQVDVVRIDVDGHSIVHASDIGQSPARTIPGAFRRPDLLLVPVGGFFTVGAAQAREWCGRIDPTTIIPIHYKTSACQLPLRSFDAFVRYFSDVEHLEQASFELTDELLTFHSSIVVLRPACVARI